MNAILKYRGRTVTDAQAAFIRELIAAQPGFRGRRLSAELCRAWNWGQPNGQPRDMICRGRMLALHRAGQITMAPQKSLPRNPSSYMYTDNGTACPCWPENGNTIWA